MEKTCFKCGKQKPLSEYYRHKGMADGHLNKCKACTKRDVMLHRKENIEKIRAYDRRRYRENPERQAQLRSLDTRYRSDPYRQAAHTLLRRAVGSGRVKKPSRCSECKKKTEPKRLHGHHDDYMKPLAVRWLCIPCHTRHHRLEQLRAVSAADPREER